MCTLLVMFLFKSFFLELLWIMNYWNFNISSIYLKSKSKTYSKLQYFPLSKTFISISLLIGFAIIHIFVVILNSCLKGIFWTKFQSNGIVIWFWSWFRLFCFEKVYSKEWRNQWANIKGNPSIWFIELELTDDDDV